MTKPKPKDDDLPPPPKGFREHMQHLGRKGGRIGGARRAKNLTAAERQAIARKGGHASAKKRKAKKDHNKP